MRKRSYLWAVALVALSLSLGSGMAFAQATPSWVFDSDTIPSALSWDATSGVSVNILNDGGVPWNSTFGLESVQGITGAAIPINRWGLTLVPVAGTVPTGGAQATFEFTITGPPISSLRYDAPVGPTQPGSETQIAFDCNWILASGITPTSTAGTLIPTDTVIAPVTVSRFPDIVPGTIGGSFRFWVEELGGAVPFIVQGFEDGTYRPLDPVIRGQMASFLKRSLKIPTGPFEGLFTDVPDELTPHALDIEACARAHVAEGYLEPDGSRTFRPFNNVLRDQMAVFIARAVAGGDAFVPTGPSPGVSWPQDFDDVPPTGAVASWAFNQVEFLFHTNAIAQGFVPPPHGTYGPGFAVDRGQMAIFIWRAFVRPTAAPVVLAGPAVTSVDPITADYIGWSSISQGPQAAPGFAYIGFDAVRLNPSIVFPKTPTGTWNVLFELVPVSTPTAPVITHLVQFDVALISAAHAAALATGDPYLFAVWQIDSGLPKGDYDLTAFAADETGVLFEVNVPPLHRQHLRFTIN